MVKRQRKPNRLSGYDYSQSGAYFITICTHNRKMLFGNIIDGVMELNGYGRIVQSEIESISAQYENISIDTYVIMPNHVHCIVRIVGTGLAPVREGKETQPENRTTARVVPTVPGIIGALKSKIANVALMNHKNGSDNYLGKIWQRSYHDHIIRGETEYAKICEYINSNPQNWNHDCFFSKSVY